MGAALLADVWGFTVLADALVTTHGPQRGAEELTRHLNLIYGALLGPVDRYGGAVLGFSGDAITCWFDAASAGSTDEASRRAATCALGMQEEVLPLARIDVPGSEPVGIAPKIAIVAGPARRFRVGDPSVQCFEVLAGGTLDRLAATERLATRGEIVLDGETAGLLGDAIRGRALAGRDATVLDGMMRPAPATPWPPPARALADAELRPWLLSAVYERLLAGHGEFLAELRPAVAVFVRFGGIDYDGDDGAGEKLDRYVRWVQGIVLRYEGALIDLTFGDKGSYLYVAFGAPTAHENDAERALRAALELRALPDELSFVSPVQIGISRGRTRAGPIGGPTRRAYTVTGNEVNVAARLMQAAAPGEVLVSAHVLEGTRAGFAVRAIEPITVKGREEPVRVVALEALQERSSPRVELLPDGAATMLGRERELGQAVEKMVVAATGAGQLLAITAEAGLGKSRLLEEVVRGARARGFAVHAGEAQSFGTIATYLAWHGVWRGVLGVEAGLAAEEQVAALERALASIDPALVPRLPLLGPVVGITIPDNELTQQFEAKLRKDSLEALLATCLRASSARGPVLIAIEDVHWMDPLSIELLESVGRAIAGMSVLLVTTSRPHESDGKATARAASLPHFSEMRLGELGADASKALIERAVRAGFGEGVRVPERFVEVVRERAEGNPFLVEELVSFLVDRGITPQQVAAGEAIELPGNLAGAILGRIDRLTTTQQTTLKIASVIGRSYAFDWLWGVHPEIGERARVREDLEELAHRGLAAPQSGESGGGYEFKHSLIQEVVYESLPFAMRAKLHEQLAGWLEERGGAGVDLLAFHYGRSENVAKQREYFRKAGDAAAARYANEAAGEYYERLRAVVSVEEQPGVLLSLGTVRMLVSRWDEAEKHCRRALELIERDPPRAFRARLRMAIGEIHTHRAAHEEGLRWLEQAREEFTTRGDRAGTTAALIEIANTHWRAGDFDRAEAVLNECLALEGEDGEPPRISRAFHVLGNVMADKGDISGARKSWARSLTIRRKIADKPGIAIMVVNTAVAAFLEQKYVESRELLGEALGRCNELGMRWEATRARELLALTLAAQGELATARDLFIQNMMVLRDLGALRELAELMVSMLVTWRFGDMTDSCFYVLRIAGAGSRLFETLSSPMPARIQAQVNANLTEIRAYFGPARADQAWAEGHRLDWASAVAYALTQPRVGETSRAG